MSLVKPFIHSNGTSAAMLFRGYKKADSIAQKLQAALREIEFNQRDYYLLPEGEWDRAVAEFRRLQSDMAVIQQDLAEIAFHCYERIEDRNERMSLLVKVKEELSK